jgi:hypothetical protein
VWVSGVEITPTVQFIKMPHNITYLYTSLNGSMVGLTGNSLVTVGVISTHIDIDVFLKTLKEQSTQIRSLNILK